MEADWLASHFNMFSYIFTIIIIHLCSNYYYYFPCNILGIFKNINPHDSHETRTYIPAYTIWLSAQASNFLWALTLGRLLRFWKIQTKWYLSSMSLKEWMIYYLQKKHGTVPEWQLVSCDTVNLPIGFHYNSLQIFCINTRLYFFSSS